MRKKEMSFIRPDINRKSTGDKCNGEFVAALRVM